MGDTDSGNNGRDKGREEWEKGDQEVDGEVGRLFHRQSVARRNEWSVILKRKTRMVERW